MRRTSFKFKLPLWVAASLLTATTAWAQAPVVPNVPQEDAYQLRALPPQEAQEEAETAAPNRYLETEFLKERGIATYGWINAGIGGNGWGSPFNGPITFNDRNWQGQMNQLYLVNEKVMDLEDGGFDYGGRIDLLYGTDSIYTVARGLDASLANQGNWAGIPGGPNWASSKDYGLAMPQLYGELGYGNHAVKFGHFYTIIGYEVVPAIGNFFYTHAYTMQYGEPFTHTGILDTYTVNDQMTVYAGITNGWDNFSDPINSQAALNPLYPGANSNAAFLGGVTFKNSDATQALTIAATSGNEPVAFLNAPVNVGNRSMFSTVYTNEINDKVTYVFQNDNGWQFNAGSLAIPTANMSQPGTAQWYGINQYLFYNFSDTVVGGMRFEWFRDNNGYRVFNPIRNAVAGGPYSSGYQGNFWEMSYGLNWKPNRNWIIRPELRYDWYSPDAAGGPLPFGQNVGQIGGAGDQYGQLYGGCDAIWQF